MAVILAAANPSISTYTDEIFSAFPDVNSSDYTSVFGTSWLDYFMDWAGELGAKAMAVFSLVGAVTVWPTFSLYDQTVSPSSFPPMAAIQLVPMIWLGVGVWERIPAVGSG